MKPDPQLIESLSQVPLFAGCTKRQLRDIANSGKLLSKRDGSAIVTQDSKGVAFFSILSGVVEIKRGEQVVAHLMPGEFFGEMALLGNGAMRNASVVASGDVQVFALSEWTFRALLRRDAKIAYEVARAVAARVAN